MQQPQGLGGKERKNNHARVHAERWGKEHWTGRGRLARRNPGNGYQEEQRSCIQWMGDPQEGEKGGCRRSDHLGY